MGDIPNKAPVERVLHMMGMGLSMSYSHRMALTD